MLKWQRVHRILSPEFDGLIMVNKEDVASLISDARTLKKEHVCVIPNGVDTDYFKPSNNHKVQKSLSSVFSGNMKSEQSETAVMFFLPIFEELRKRHSNLSWYIVGRDPTPKINRIGLKCQGVHVTGYVEDICPYLEQAEIYIAPMQTGTGVRNRVLEAMAMGCAVVASPHGCSALRGQADLPIAIASNDLEFKDKVEEILINPSMRDELGCRVRKYVIKHHSWRAGSEQVLTFAQSTGHVPETVDT